MPGATQAISLLLVGTGLCAFGYQASQRSNDDAFPSSQPSSGYNGYSSGGGYHSYHSGYSSFSDDDSSISHSSHSSSTERGGFGSIGHGFGHGSASG